MRDELPDCLHPAERTVVVDGRTEVRCMICGLMLRVMQHGTIGGESQPVLPEKAQHSRAHPTLAEVETMLSAKAPTGTHDLYCALAGTTASRRDFVGGDGPCTCIGGWPDEREGAPVYVIEHDRLGDITVPGDAVTVTFTAKFAEGMVIEDHLYNPYAAAVPDDGTELVHGFRRTKRVKK